VSIWALRPLVDEMREMKEQTRLLQHTLSVQTRPKVQLRYADEKSTDKMVICSYSPTKTVGVWSLSFAPRLQNYGTDPIYVIVSATRKWETPIASLLDLILSGEEDHQILIAEQDGFVGSDVQPGQSDQRRVSFDDHTHVPKTYFNMLYPKLSDSTY